MGLWYTTFHMEPRNYCIFLNDTTGLLSSNSQWRPQDCQTSCGHKVSRSMCPYYLKGYCKFGSDCRGYHPPSLRGVGGRGKGNSTRLPGDRCRICGTITDPPHWGNECPWKVIG